MMNFTGDDFGRKCLKLTEKLKEEEAFYLGHFDANGSHYTVFGNGYIVFCVPQHVGQEEDAVRATSVMHLLRDRFWSEDAERCMKWVPLPKASELKPGRNLENPVKCHLAATDLEPGRELSEECATYPFAVQARYLKMALQLAPFMGQKDTRSFYNPLCLWARDDFGNEISAVIMPMRESR